MLNDDVCATDIFHLAIRIERITTTDLDAPGPSVVYVNPAFERMTGWSNTNGH